MEDRERVRRWKERLDRELVHMQLRGSSKTAQRLREISADSSKVLRGATQHLR